jgi:hypothetical protein
VIGTSLAALARRLLRDETFRLMVAPAIADLQIEHRSRHLLALARDYAVISWVLARAIGRDLLRDAASLGAPNLREVWPRVLGLYLLIFLVRAFSRIDRGLRLHTPDMAPGEFTTLPLPAAGDGLEPYLAGLLATLALACVGYAAVPAVFMLRRRHVNVRALVLGVLSLAVVSYGAARLVRPAVQQSSDYAAAAIMRGSGLYPADEPLAVIIREEVLPRRETPTQRALATLANGGHDPETATLASRRWTELSLGLGVVVYALIGAAIARGSGIGVLSRLAGIMATRFALGFLLPYLSVMLWPVYPAALRPFERSLLESQLAFVLLPLVACLFLVIPRRQTRTRRAV